MNKHFEATIERIIKERYPLLLNLPIDQIYQRFLNQNNRDFIQYGKSPQKSSLIVNTKGAENKEGVFEIFDKGCCLHLEGEAYPIRGVLRSQEVTVLSQLKRFIPLLGRFAQGQKEFKLQWWQKVIVVIGLTQFWKFFVEWLWFAMSDILLPPDLYSQPVRELYRVIKNNKLRDIICSVIEFDTAYRYKFQDIISELNKQNFQKHPYKEMKRLWDIVKEREGVDFWRAKGVRFYYVYFLFPYMKQIKAIVRELNIDEVKPSVEDWYWMCSDQQLGYNFGGIPAEKRTIYYHEKRDEVKN